AMPLMMAALDASLIGEAADVETPVALATLRALNAALAVEPLLQQGAMLEPVDSYERLALDRALSAIQWARRAMAAGVIRDYGGGEVGVQHYLAARGDTLTRLRRDVERLSAAPLTQARLSVLASQLGELVG
ncbi:MAG: NAD-glutamate dehydrogenase, partial [Proteobacteria bacterium]|nr:NAD-glutamate dehydrogenase [Pseudomonadota bacterium]